jgi:hypothetical protein
METFKAMLLLFSDIGEQWTGEYVRFVLDIRGLKISTSGNRLDAKTNEGSERKYHNCTLLVITLIH